MRKLILFVFLCTSFSVVAQEITQNVKGRVVDAISKFPLMGVKITLEAADSSQSFVNGTNADGYFKFKDIPIGKYTITASFMTYKPSSQSVYINSGKESVVNLSLQEDVATIKGVEIVGNRVGEVNNKMAMVSAREFSVEETNRYAGSRGDPARMASNFAGVQGADDSRNDIIIRGNSPLGVVWRVEGVNIPNPNHFATSGSSGGPVGILNNKILANSDFFMSTFPAEYGNSVSGVFDLQLRKGNTDKHEFSGQFGLLGTEIMAEGPFNRENKSSYLVMARYSTLSIFQSLNIKIGTDAVPQYGDIAFNLSFPLKKGGYIGVFGIGGMSDISIMVSDRTEPSKEAFGEGDRDQYFGTDMGVVGVSYKKPISRNTFFQATLAQSYANQHSLHNYLVRSIDTLMQNGSPSYKIRTDSIFPLMGYVYHTFKTGLYTSINHKINKHHIIKAGLSFDGYYLNYLDTALNKDFMEGNSYFITRDNYKGFSFLIQPFFTYKWKISNKMTFTAGLHSQYFSLSDSWSYIEPRIGWRWRLKHGNTISAGTGMHSQLQPLYQYIYQRPVGPDGEMVRLNEKIGFTRSIPFVIGYQKNFKNNMVIKTEAYYQYLYNIPVTTYASHFSLINQGSGFQRFWPDKLVNKGTGQNYGIELTVRKRFNKSYYYLFTGSLYKSLYKGSDGIQRHSDFDGTFTLNILGGKEFKINERNTISVGLKATYAGGKRYGYVDIDASRAAHELVYLDSAFNTRKFKNYFRIDLKVKYTLNTPNITHEIGIDLVNVLNTKNILSLTFAPNLFDPTEEPIAEKYQLGFLPIFYYRIDFTFGRKK